MPLNLLYWLQNIYAQAQISATSSRDIKFKLNKQNQIGEKTCHKTKKKC